MSVSSSDVKLYRASVNNDASTNGGKRTYTEIVSAVMNNLFPNVTNAERVAGLERYRKCFLHNINTDEDAFEEVKFFIDFRSTGDDRFCICEGTYNDTQANAEDYDGSYKYTCGSASGGAFSVGDIVNDGGTKLGVVTEFVDGSYIRLRTLSDVGESSEQFETGDTVYLQDAAGTTSTTSTAGGGTVQVTLTGDASDRNTAWAGTGYITTGEPVTAGDDHCHVTFDDDEYIKGHIMPGDMIFISSLENVSDTTNHLEFHEVESIDWSGNNAVITITDTFSSSFSVLNGVSNYHTRVGKYLEIGSLTTSYDTVVKSINGTFDETQMIIKQYGAKRDSLTITFVSTTTVNITGTNVATYVSGASITGAISPINPSTGTPYFTIPSAAWGGTFNINDEITMEIYPADQAIWFIEVVPAGAASTSNNSTWVMIVGESA